MINTCVGCGREGVPTYHGYCKDCHYVRTGRKLTWYRCPNCGKNQSHDGECRECRGKKVEYRQRMLSCQVENGGSDMCDKCGDRFKCLSIKARKFRITQTYTSYTTYFVYGETDDEAKDTLGDWTSLFEGEHGDDTEDEYFVEEMVDGIFHPVD